MSLVRLRVQVPLRRCEAIVRKEVADQHGGLAAAGSSPRHGLCHESLAGAGAVRVADDACGRFFALIVELMSSASARKSCQARASRCSVCLSTSTVTLYKNGCEATSNHT